MRRIRSGITPFTLSCLLTIVPATFAQSSGQVAVGPVSSSLVSAAAVDLPDAPLPAAQSTASSSQSQSQQQTPPAGGQKPAQQSNEPSLSDLGFSPTQTEANAKLQARLNRRTHMLKVHQTLGLITLAPMAATVLVASGAKSKHVRNASGGFTDVVTPPSDAGVDLHVALGSLTTVMYAATAYYAIAAPKIPGVKPKGAIRLHRDLVWIHLPGMVLTPILGSMALSQENNGQKPHGIAAQHGTVAGITVAAYALSAVAVSWPIHIHF